MKNLKPYLFIALLSLFFGCKHGPKDSKKQAEELLSIKTLGLAYLEEFKLDEAKVEFLKFIDIAPDEKLGYANLGLTYLRMGKYKEAEEQLNKAIKIDSKDPDIRLILATVYQMSDRPEKAIEELKGILQFAPAHIKALYQLSELYLTKSDTASQNNRLQYLVKLVENAPGNLVSRLNLIDILIRKGELEKAIAQLEDIHQQFPEFPKEAVEYYDKSLSLLKKKDRDEAQVQFTIFHNYLKVTAPYQAGITDLKGPGGSLIGFPVITFDQPGTAKNIGTGEWKNVIKFTDATETAGLGIVTAGEDGKNPEYKYTTHVEVADYDGDGDIDLYVGSYDAASSTYKHYLFNNEMGRFKDVASASGLDHSGKEFSAAFADYDNDGFMDLYIVKEGGDLLYRNNGKGIFENVSSKAKLSKISNGKKVIFFDADQDGDLDFLEIGGNSNLLFRNNSDGTFEEQAEKMGLKNGKKSCTDAAYGDFNESGDLDLITVNQDSPGILFSNQRQGNFKDITEKSGIKTKGGATVVAVGDYNNDGFLDIFIASTSAEDFGIYTNQRDGSFKRLGESALLFPELKKIKSFDAKFFDFDNDGLLDILVAGEPLEKDGNGVVLYHNDGKGKFTNASSLLPANIKSAKQIALFDYNDDGDIDIVLAGLNGGVSLLRNDGGNNNHYIKMKLVGLRTGSAKNNYFGIGARVELRAGDLYQSMVVTDPNIHFGLGNRLKADVLRITWTNGVPQNMFFPGTDQSLIESQVLKGSCPFLYTWDGEKFEFSRDILWRSALGMPTGIMGGNTSYAFADASDDYLKIPSDKLKVKDGKYAVQLTAELWETIYFDKLQLVAVDHPDSVDIFVPEQFTPPPFPGMQLFQVKNKILPVTAVDENGNDLLPLIAAKDDKYVSDLKPGKYQGITEMQDLIIDAGRNIDTKNLYLFLNGWIFPTDASINLAISQSSNLKVIPPLVQVINKKGEWETIPGKTGFPMGKDKTVVLDLSGKIISSDHRIRIRTNMQIYWDQVFFSDVNVKTPVHSTVLDPSLADLHYRGFSATYRKGGRYGPHWFDYSRVDKNQKWRDLVGNYTRYGDVLPLLKESDSKYIIMNAGDEVSLEFSASGLPVLPAGWKRDFLVHSVGWVKDGDLNTANSTTVLPLPFHGMSSYPPSAKDIYPTDAEHQKYLKEYNTRVVTSDEFVNRLKGEVIK